MYFFDTYAILEIINGNENYRKFEQLTIITSVLNLGELYYILLKQFSDDEIKQRIGRFKLSFLEITPNAVVNAARLRFKNKKKGLSYIDCISYAIALEKELKFLTGDKEFKSMPNVEFVK